MLDRVPALRRDLLTRAPRPYDEIMLEDVLAQRYADRILAEGWTMKPLPPVRLDPPVAWETVCAENRSWAFHLQSWDALGPVLHAVERVGDPRYLRFARGVVLDWIARYPNADEPSQFAWYDMAVGLRAYRLAYVLDRSARDADVPDADLETMLDALLVHRAELARDDTFAAHSNHGVFQAAGQLAMAVRFPALPGMAETQEQALRRLDGLMDDQYTGEGVHREHSPGYHAAVTGTFGRIVRTGLIADAGIRRRYEEAEAVMASFITPDGAVAPLGDTGGALRWDVDPEEVASGALRYVLTDGRSGTPPPPLTVYPESGYAVLQSAPAEPGASRRAASYLLLNGAFHSRTHKHADDLSLIWHEGGHELLTDGGRFGYLGKTKPGSDLFEQGFWYADPGRVYAEGTAAHSTVQLDGRSHERKGVRPYGSAIQRWGQTGDVAWVEASVRHRRTIIHTRMLLFRPGRWLVVLDAVVDTAGAPHRIDQRFLFGPDLDAAADPAGGLRLTAPGLADPLWMTALLPAAELEPVRGAPSAEAPELGWVSKDYRVLTPTWSGGFTADGVPSQVFGTLFAFAPERPAALPGHSRANVSGRKVRLGWETADGPVRLDVDRAGTDVAVTLDLG